MNQEVHFTNIRKEIIKHLRTCRVELKIAVAWFTDEEIITEISKLAERGIKVSIIFYDDNINNKKLFENLYYNNVNLFLSKKMMHNKFCIIDNYTVINGSYNWTISASSNDENIQITYDNILLTEKFDEQFNKIASNCKSIDEYFKYSVKALEKLNSDFHISYSRFPKYKFPYFLDCSNLPASYENKKLKINDYIYLIRNKNDEKKMQWFCSLLNTNFSIFNILKIKKEEFLLPPAFDYVHNTRYDKNNVWEFVNKQYVVEVSRMKKHLGSNIPDKYLFAIDITGAIVSDEISFSRKISSEIYFGGSSTKPYFINKNLEKTDIKFEIEFGQNNDLFIVKKDNKYGMLNKHNQVVIPIQFDDVPEKYYKFDKFVDFIEYPLFSFDTSKNVINKPWIHNYNIYTKEFNVDVTVHRYSTNDYKLIETFIVKGKNNNYGYYFSSEENYKFERFYNKFKEFKFHSKVHVLDKVNTSLTLEEFNALKSYYNDEYNLRSLLSIYFGQRITLQYKKNSEKKSEGCYIATMVYKNYHHPNVIILRNFRDCCLKGCYLGDNFIRFYYFFSPFFVKYVEDKKVLYNITKVIIIIIINVVKLLFNLTFQPTVSTNSKTREDSLFF